MIKLTSPYTQCARSLTFVIETRTLSAEHLTVREETPENFLRKDESGWCHYSKAKGEDEKERLTVEFQMVQTYIEQGTSTTPTVLRRSEMQGHRRLLSTEYMPLYTTPLAAIFAINTFVLAKITNRSGGAKTIFADDIPMKNFPRSVPSGAKT